MVSALAGLARREDNPELSSWIYDHLFVDGEAVPKAIWHAIVDEPDDDKKTRFLQIPHHVLDDSRLAGLGTGEWLLYIVLWRYCWGGDRCHPSIETLAKGTHASTKSVERWLHGHGKSTGLCGYRPGSETGRPLVTCIDRGKESNQYVLNYKKITPQKKSKKVKKGNGQFV
jgi:hypothetical protein